MHHITSEFQDFQMKRGSRNMTTLYSPTNSVTAVCIRDKRLCYVMSVSVWNRPFRTLSVLHIVYTPTQAK